MVSQKQKKTKYISTIYDYLTFSNSYLTTVISKQKKTAINITEQTISMFAYSCTLSFRHVGQMENNRISSGRLGYPATTVFTTDKTDSVSLSRIKFNLKFRALNMYL